MTDGDRSANSGGTVHLLHLHPPVERARRYPRRFADDFAACDLAEFAARWWAQTAAADPGQADRPERGSRS